MSKLVRKLNNVKLTGQPRPSLNHPELELLYQTGWDKMTEASVNELVALPRESLISDLRAILRDGLERYEELAAEEDIDWNTLGFPIHAMRLLGAIGADEALPDILDYFRLESPAFDFYLGELGEGYLFPVFYQLAENRLSLLFDYLKQGNNFWYARVVPDDVPAQLMLRNPERREEVLDAYTDLVETYITADLTEGVADPECISSLVIDLVRTRDTAFLPLVKKLFEADLIYNGICGNFPEVEESFRQPPRIDRLRPLPETAFEFFSNAHVARQSQAIQEEYRRNRTDKPMKRAVTKRVIKSKRIGRNEKCPCGSGRKYKHCCGRG